jgi:hypothetical protein
MAAAFLISMEVGVEVGYTGHSIAEKLKIALAFVYQDRNIYILVGLNVERPSR